MDHDEVREHLELAAAEPDGLVRLAAGDTAAARAVAAHLAGCESCAAELQRLERSAPLLRDVVRTTPAADLRERTLAFVAAQGIDRSGSAVVGGPIPLATTPSPVPVAAASGANASDLRRVLPWVGAIAAAVLLSVLAATAVVSNRYDERLAALDHQVEGLETVTLATIDITANEDTQRVNLASTGGTMAAGNLLFSPSTTQLVVVATGLTEPPEGQEYRCWIEAGGSRTSIGKMFFAEDLAYWVGPAPSVSTAEAGTSFGVSLTEVENPTPAADPVIAGKL
jgi:Anti-sigma-K factor rskA, C-terminal